MKMFKYVTLSITLLILVLTLIWKIWSMTSLEGEYTEELAIGNQYIANIEAYIQQENKLPDENDRSTLEKLNPFSEGKVYDEHIASWPVYMIQGTGEFTLTFVEGLDGPYLTYDSSARTRSMR